jgi:hypothetical protein
LNPYTEKPFIKVREMPPGESLTSKVITEFVLNNMPFLGEILDKENLRDFLAEDLNKVILFTNKKKPSALYKALASTYRGRVQFGLVYDTETTLVAKYKIGNFPAVLSIAGEEINGFEGDLELDALAAFCDKLASDTKHPAKLKKRRTVNTPQEEAEMEHFRLPEFP